MILKKLSLKDFRSYSKKELEFSDKITLISGPNASGKTNILEAVFLLASGKSFRVKGVESEMVSYGQEMTRVKGEIREAGEDKEAKDELEIVLTRGEVMGERVAKKKYLVNGVGKRAIDFVGNLRAVYFGPEDLELITDSPSLRRKYLDYTLVQVDREYGRASLSYEKGLRARNKILEDIKEWRGTAGFSEETFRKRLYFWDQLLIKDGNLITRKREEYLEFLNGSEGFGGSPRGFTPRGFEGFGVEYDRSTISLERLAQYKEEEVGAGTTLVGPHRDDFVIKLKTQNSRLRRSFGGQAKLKTEEERDLSIYGSRGEQRLAILWMKLGERAFIKEKTGSFPILLLDDIFSELDVEHRKLVFAVVGEQQTIMTTADLGMVEKDWLKEVKIIKLD